MSRWTDSYKTHAFRDQWSRWKDAVENIASDDPTLIPHTSELARLRKATRYVEGALSGLDPELIPLTFWDQLRDQMSAGADQIQAFNASKNIGHVHNAQNNLDVILSFVRPYILTKGPLGATLQGAAEAYAETLESSAKKLEKSIVAAAAEISNQKDAVKEYASEAERKSSEILLSYDRLFVGSDDQDPIKDQIEEIFAEFNEYSNELSVGTDSVPSIKQSISLAKGQALKDGEAISLLLTNLQNSVRDLQAFHTSVFGKPDADGVPGKMVSGTINLCSCFPFSCCLPAIQELALQSTDSKFDLVLSYPQWQGSGRSEHLRRGAAAAADVCRQYGPLMQVADAGEGEAKGGINRWTALLEQFRSAKAILDEHQPQRILTAGGDCACDIAVIDYLKKWCQGQFIQG